MKEPDNPVGLDLGWCIWRPTQRGEHEVVGRRGCNSRWEPDNKNTSHLQKWRRHPKHDEESLKTTFAFNKKVNTTLRVFLMLIVCNWRTKETEN